MASLPRNSLLALLAAALLSGCAAYMNNRDTITLGAGDAMEANLGLHTLDPFPVPAKNTRIRVDGENFPTGPIEVILARHPDVLAAAAYGVPDPEAGDRVMAALVLRDGATFDPAGFAAWVDAQPDLAPKWRPTHLRVTTTMPTSPTNKVLVRVLAHEKYRPDLVGGDPLWWRGRGDAAYSPFGEAEAAQLHDRLRHFGRERFWDL